MLLILQITPLTSTSVFADPPNGSDPINIGSRRELFVDDFLIQSLTSAELKAHKPDAREVVLTCDLPWEGNTSAYYTLLQDGDLFRAYYRGAHFNTETKKEAHPEVTCYAESSDGIHWKKPELGLFEFNGSKQNNIVWTGTGTHNFTPFRDTAPDCAKDAKYKALAGGTTLVDGKKKHCLNALKSADGIHWEMMAEGVITEGAFDSQNLAFRDNVRNEYRAYWRIFTAGHTDERGWKPSGVRAIRTATSKDFLHWENQADLTYVDSPPEHLYTNAIRSYDRAPHLFVGFPTRFQPKTQQVEPVFMSSRDGVLFRRWSEELIPITAPKDRDGNRSNYMTSALLHLPGNPNEVSVFATEAYYTGPGSRVRRFTFRTDGFVSVHAVAKGELITKPIVFSGTDLKLNIHSLGDTRVEVQTPDGKPVPGFSANDCNVIKGDSIDQSVTWKSAKIASLAGQPVRLRILMERVHLYALQFSDSK